MKTTDVTSSGWWIWFLAALFYAYEFIQRVSVSVMVPQLMGDLGVGATAIGSLSAYYYYVYAATQVPAGYAFDRYSLRWTLTFASFAVTLGSLMMALAQSLWLLQFARALTGFGSAFAFVGCLKLGASWMPHNRMPLLIGLTNAMGVAGALLGGGPLAYALHYLDWRLLYWHGAWVGLILTLALSLWIKPGQHHLPLQPQAPGYLKILLSDRFTWIAALYGLLMVAPIAAFAELWGTPYLTQHYHMSNTQAATYISCIFVGIALGGPFFGWLSRSLKPAILLPLGSLGATAILSLLLQDTLWPLYQLPWLLGLYGFLTSHMLMIFSLVSWHHPDEHQGIAIGFTNTVIMAGGAIFQPFIGYLVESVSAHHWITGHSLPMLDPLALSQALMILPLCLLIGTVLSLFFTTRSSV